MKRLFLLIIVVASTIHLFAQVQKSDTVRENTTMPTIIMIDSEYDETNSSTDISSFLQSSRDPFSNIAAYNLSARRYRIRAYDSKYTDVMINGVIMNDPESGRPYYSNWGGLNDAMRNTTITINNGLAYESFGGPAGVTAISTRASNYRRQAQISYSASNRSYNNRLMATVGTGMMKNGWAFAVSASYRFTPMESKLSWSEGTWYDAYSYFLSAEKKFNDKHSLGFLVFGAPSNRAGSSPAVQEVFDLLGNNYYNPNWGWQTGSNGEKFMRNARVSSYHQPMFQLQHYWTPNSKLKVNTTAYYWFGKGGSTALEWGEAADPRPDYYRNLPSYYLYQLNNGQEGYTWEGYEAYKQQWIEDESMHQIDWDALYATNSRTLKTIDNANNIEGNTVQGKFSKYIVEQRRQDKNQAGLTSSFSYELNPNIHFNGGLKIGVSKTHYYKLVADLLGGDYYLDIDKYADGEAFEITDEQQVNLLNKNHVAVVGDIIGYNYIANNNKALIWAQADYTKGHWTAFVGAEGSFTQMYRTGLFENGRFSGNESYGDSEKLNFINGSAKAGASYAINGRNYIVANVMFKNAAPDFRSAFVAPRVRNTVVNGLDSEKIFSYDLGYEYRSPSVKARLSLYRSDFYDLTWNRSFYYEATGKFVNYIMNDMDQYARGIELGAEINITPTISMQLAGSVGEHRYSNRPKVNVYEDNNAEPIFEGETVYLKNYYVGEMPQTVGSVGLKYNSPKFWWISVNANYFADYYLAVNPTNHTADAYNSLYLEDYRTTLLLDQEKLPNAMTLDLYAGKSWSVKGYTILLNVSVNNILNNKNIILYGYEQLRSDYAEPDRFPEKYSYVYGLNYFVSLTIRH
ncbi:MAG: hypothetical protein ACI358_07585 [Candidatus Limimorpha sp.]